MNLDWRRSLDDPVTEPRDALALAGPLVASLVGVVPIVALAGRAAGVGLLPSLLGALAVVGAGYLAVIYVRRQLVAGAYVAFLVLTTFSANLPIGASREFHRVASGSVGPQLWLYQGPLLVVVGYLLWTREFSLDSFRRSEIVFGSFVAWTFVSALLGSGPRTDVALFFSWLMVQAWVAFVVIGRGVRRNVLSLESVMTTYIVTLVGHIAFGAAQFWNDAPIGLTFLGEGVTWHPPISFVLGGAYQLIPTGFTGHGYVLVTLILLTFPTILLFVHRSETVSATAAIGAALLSVIFLRLTTSDAGRGAFLVLVVTLAAGAVVLSKYTRVTRSNSLRDVLSGVRSPNSGLLRSLVVAVTGVLVVLSPSSNSGSSSEAVGAIDPDPDTVPTDGPATPVETPSPSGGSEVTEISVPLFDLTHLGTRLQQVVVGLEMFSRNALFGVGGGNYRFVAATYGLPNRGGLPVPPTVHNIYVKLLAETGLPGFVLYFGAIGLVAISGLRSSIEGHKRYLHFAVLVSFVSYFSLLFFTHLIDNANSLLPFWAIAGAVVGENRSNGAGDEEGSPTTE